MLAVKNGLDKLERENSLAENNIDLREFPFREVNSSAVELLEETAEAKERKAKIKSLKRIYSLRYLCWGLVIASFFWQIFASVIYFSRKNYLASSPFIINCDERFVLDKGYFCQDKLRFLEGQSFFFDFTVRILTMAVFLFLSVNFCAAERTKKEQGIGKVKSAFRWFFWTISLYSIMYLITNCFSLKVNVFFNSEPFSN